MNRKFEEAVGQVRALPDERQEEAADLLIDYLNSGTPDIYLTPEQMADIARAAEAEEGPVATDDDIRRVLPRLTK